MNGFQVKFIV